MAEERKLIISLEVNAKGEATLRAIKKEVDELAKADEKRAEQGKRAAKDEKEVTTEREKGAQVVRRRRKEEQALADDVSKGAKATEKSKNEEEKRATSLDRGRRVVSRKKDEEKAHTVAVDEGAKAVDRSRDSLGRFVGAGERAKRTVVELANSQGQLTTAIGLGVIKAQLFLNIVSTGFRIGIGLAINPTLKLAGGIKSLVENVVQATQRFDRFRITLEGALKSADRARAVSNFVQEYALTSPVKIEDVQELTKSIALIPALRGQFFGDFDEVKNRLRDIYDTVIGLSSLNPQQGIPGAVFAIREALAGQFRSLRARFDIMPEIVAGSIGKTVSEIKKSPKLVIAALKEFVNQSVGSDTLRELGRLPEVRIGNIVEALTSIAPRQIGSAGFQSFIQDLLGQIDDSLQGFFKDGGPFQTQFAPRISERLRGIVIQSLRLLGNILGGVDTALGGGGAPTMERIAQVFESVLGRVEQAIKGFADRFAQSRDSIANFFSTIVEVLKKSFDLFVDIVNNLPSILPVFAGFFNAMVELTRQVFNFISAIPKLLGEIGANNLLSVAAPGLAESFRTTGNVSAVSELINTQRGDRSAETEFKAASDALMDLALEGKDAFRDMQEGFKDPRRGFFREFFRGEISAGGDRRNLIQQILTQLGASGSKDRGSDLADRIAAEGASVQASISARNRLNEALTTSAEVQGRLTSRIEEREKLEKDIAEAEKGVVSRLNAQTFEIETTTPLSPQLAGAGLKSTTSRQAVPAEEIRRSLAQLINRVPGEFGGSVAGIKDLGLQVQERLSKLLLDPLQEADQEFIQAEAAHALAVENLAKAVEGATSEAAERVKTAIEQVDKDIGAGILTAEQGAELRKRIFDTWAKVTEAIGKASAVNTRDSARYFTQAVAGGFQSAVGALTKTDLNDAQELDRAFAGVNSRLAIMEPLLTEIASTTFADLQGELSAILRELKPDSVSVGTSFLGFDPAAALDLVTKAKADFRGLGEVVSVVNGLISDPIGLVGDETQRRLTALVDRVNEFTATLGREGVKNLASFAFASRSQEFQKTQGIKGAFGGGTPQAEIASLEEQLRVVQTRSKVEERIREILNDRAVLDKERAEFETQITRLTKEQIDGIALTLAVKRQALEISKAEETLQRSLQTEFDPETRYGLIKTAVGAVQEQIEGIKKALDDPTGEQVALLLGIADPNKARAAAEGAVQALEARRKQLEDTAKAADPLEASRRAQQGIPGRTISAQGAFDALPKSQREAIIAEYGELGTQTATAFLDKFSLLTSDGAKARLKTFGELLNEEIVQLAVRVVDLVQTAVGDTLYNVFKGEFDSIQQVWDNFLDGLLRAFADFIAQLLVRAAVMQAIESFGGFGFAEGGIVGSVTPLANGAVVGPGAGGPIMALIGEGSRKEGIVPLTTAGAIPATVTNQGLAATLPGNRTIPIAIGGYANGGVVSGAQPVAMPKFEAPPVYVINTLDSAEVVAAGLPANAVIVENQVAGSIRSRGAVGKSLRRYGRG